MNRRDFVHATGAMALGGLVFTSVGCQPAETGEEYIELIRPVAPGLQLYTVREVLEDDFFEVLTRIAAIGYEELEFAGLHGHDPRTIRQHMDDLGLRAPSTHKGLEELENGFGDVVEEAHTLGHRYVVVPWLAEDRRQAQDDYRRVADDFNEIGRRLDAEGLRFGYHNHAFEFDRFDGVPGYDLLLQHTDPEFVAMEMDLFWTVDAGEDPLDYLERYPGRFPLFHVKDRAPDGEMVDVGDGTIPFDAILERAADDGLEHAFVEHDHPADPMTTIEASFNFFTA